MLVRDLTEQLARFNPEARLVPDVDAQGVAPNVECQLNITREDELLGQIEKLEQQVQELEEAADDEKERIKDGLEDLEGMIDDLPSGLSKALLIKIESLRP